MNRRRVLIILSGCGSFDGSDPYEVAFSAKIFEEYGFEIIFSSVSGYQLSTVNHLNGFEDKKEKRKILKESSRLARGKVFYLKELEPKLFDVIIIPGGQGTIKNFTKGWGTKNYSLKPEIKNFLKKAHEEGKYIIFLSLASLLISHLFKGIGSEINLLELETSSFLINEELKLIVAPASLKADNLTQLYKGIEKIVKEIILKFE